jgi:hypothetical protein
VTILVILVYVNYLRDYDWARIVRDSCIWATIVITVLSGLLYVQRAVAMHRENRIAT